MNGTGVRINPSYRIREWSSITGKGGGGVLQNGRVGASVVLLLQEKKKKKKGGREMF